MDLFSSSRRVVSRVIGFQILTIAVLWAAFAAMKGWDVGLSAILGGIAALVPNLFFALQFYRNRERDAKSFVRSFYFAEVGKLLAAVLIFVLIFRWLQVDIISLMVTYVAALSAFWFVLLLQT